jgi:biotin synthase
VACASVPPMSTPEVSMWEAFADRSLLGEALSRSECLEVLHAPEDELLPLLQAAFRVRRAAFGRKVHIQVLENAKVGACPEDCGFCSQSSPQGSPAGEEPMESVEALVAAASKAADIQAKRFCMVTATRGPSERDLDVICEAARQIKAKHKIELCASLGLLTEKKARRLAEAGIDRFNHNLETSESYFDKVVSTHSWADRVNTVKLAKASGMETCCGGIVGLGESEEDLIDLVFALRELEVDSVPVNFLDPRPGTALAEHQRISPRYALRSLCLFRFLCPTADVRIAGGREVNLRSMQALALYPANSLFTSGYLTTDGNTPTDDMQMITDAGFEVEFDGIEPPMLAAARRVSLPIAN